MKKQINLNGGDGITNAIKDFYRFCKATYPYVELLWLFQKLK